jgi:hypothetical protein
MIDGRKIVREFVDLETGEILTVHEGDRLKLVTEKQTKIIEKIKYDKEHKKELDEQMKVWNESLGGFVFLLFEYSNELADNTNLTNEDITKLFYISTFVTYEGYIKIAGRFIDKKKLCTMLKMSRKPFDRFFNKMISISIFVLDDNKNIMINKVYFFIGASLENKNDADHTRLYINTIRSLFTNVDSRKHGQLGTYFKMIPYIHRQLNCLCFNPDDHYSVVRKMQVNDLMRIIGYTKSGAKRFINDLLSIRTKEGNALAGFFRFDMDEGKSYIYINPKITYGGNFDLPEEIVEVLKSFRQEELK